MRNFIKILFFTFFIGFALIACSKEDANHPEGDNNLQGDVIQAVTTFTLIEDILNEVAGDHVEIHNLVPTGTDPHAYDPLPDDTKAVTDADLLLYNGLNLEGGEQGWFAKMIESTEQEWDIAFKVSEGVEPLYITPGDGREEEINPHSFLDPVNGIIMTKNIKKALISVDPDNEAVYEENAKKYLKTLKEVDKEYEEKINEIPEENRILITSERAYQYMAQRYGLQEGYIWAIDTEENVSQEQITSLVEFIQEQNPPALFIESNVDPRPMETVSEESGVEIYGEIYSDEIGDPGDPGDTYVKFLRHNIEVIHQGLKQ